MADFAITGRDEQFMDNLGASTLHHAGGDTPKAVGLLFGAAAATAIERFGPAGIRLLDLLVAQAHQGERDAANETKNVLSFPNLANGSRRFAAFHDEGVALEQLAAGLGTPAEWLASAIEHLKVQTSARTTRDGNVRVSLAALDLVLMHLEALEHGIEPWVGNAA